MASYSGDDSNAVAGPTDCGDSAEAVVVARPVVQPDLISTASATAPAGAPIHDTAHLSGGFEPTGTITFAVFGPDDAGCTAPPPSTSSVTVSGNGDYGSPAFRPTAAGTYRWVARYSGDEHNHAAGPTGCDDASETVVVSKARPALRTLAFSALPIGLDVRDRAFLSGGSQPRGEITFRLYGPNDATCSGRPVFTTRQTVIGNGFYPSSRFAPGQAGTYLWVASYSGDANNDRSATRCGDAGERVLVLPRRALLTTSASPPANLRKGTRALAAGRTIYDAATLRYWFAPTGHIAFDLFGPNDASCSGPPIFSSLISVNGNGAYNSESFAPTASGTYRWMATYSGDANNRPAGPTHCGASSEQVRVTVPAVPQLATSASGAATLGGAFHDVAHLSGGSAPTGTMTFRLYGSGDSSCSGQPVFTSTVRVAGNGDYVSGSFVPTTAAHIGGRRTTPATPPTNQLGPRRAVIAGSSRSCERRT